MTATVLNLAQTAPETVWLSIDLPTWLMRGLVFVLGTICGSFVNVCVHRLPRYPHGEFWPALRGLWTPPSSCPRCRSPIPWHDNIPVLGWLLLRGRCRKCKMAISPQYPLVELGNGLLLLLLYWLEVPLGRHAALTGSCLYSELGPQNLPGLGPLAPEVWIHLRFLYHVVLMEALLAASLIDLRLMIIPDTVTLPALAVGVAGGAIVGRLNIVPVWFQEPRLARELRLLLPEWLTGPLKDGAGVPDWIAGHPHLHGLAVSLAGLMVGAGMVWMVRVVGTWILQREAMGDGDVVLMGMVGSFVGWQPVLVAFFLAPVAVLVVSVVRLLLRAVLLISRTPPQIREEIPYGPYLALGTLATLLSWDRLGPWAEQRVFGLGPVLLLLGASGVVLFAALLASLQLLKRALGWPVGPPTIEGVWTAADQTHFFAGEQVDRFTNRWRQPDDWPGIASGRGTLHEERWRLRGP